MAEADIEIILERAEERYTWLNRESFPIMVPNSSPGDFKEWDAVLN
jgi:hypothetical protein